MREIKFRGRRLYGREWVYGCFSRYSEDMGYITVDLIDREVHQVDMPSVGQFTGLRTKAGREIFEGDIVRDSVLYVLPPFEVIWRSSAMGTGFNVEYGEGRYEVIGNIHENPDLLHP